MSDKELLRAFKEYRERVGRERALSDLMLEKLSPRTAELLCAGDDYDKKPRRKVRQALEKLVGKAS